MVMSVIFTGIVALSITASLILGTGAALSASVLQGAQEGVQLVLSLSGAICLWSGLAYLMEKIGITSLLGRFFSPLLLRLFPSCQNNPRLSGCLAGNLCANLLGLGNAATPMGISAAKLLVNPHTPHTAGNELCRLVILNSASVQLIPSTVAALRIATGCSHPFDILPAVWITSVCALIAGLGTAKLLEKIWPL